MFDYREEEIVSEMMDSLAEQRKKRRRRRFSELKHPFQCHFPLCTKKYTSKGALNLHIKLKHRVNYVGSPLFPSWLVGKKAPFSVQPLCDTIAQILEQKNKGGFPLLPLPPQLQQFHYNRPFLNATSANRPLQQSVTPTFGNATRSPLASSPSSSTPSSPSSCPSSPGSPFLAADQSSDASPPSSPVNVIEKDNQFERVVPSAVASFRPISIPQLSQLSAKPCLPLASVISQDQTSEIISSKILQSLAQDKGQKVLNVPSGQVIAKQGGSNFAAVQNTEEEEDVALWLMDLKRAN